MINVGLFSQSGCTISHSHWECMSDSISPHLSQHLVLLLFFILAVLIGVHFIMVLICIFLMFKRINIFLCLSSHTTFCEVPLHIFCLYSNWIICFLLLSFDEFFMCSRYDSFGRNICCSLSFHSINRIFHRAKDLTFMKLKLSFKIYFKTHTSGAISSPRPRS